MNPTTIMGRTTHMIPFPSDTTGVHNKFRVNPGNPFGIGPTHGIKGVVVFVFVDGVHC